METRPILVCCDAGALGREILSRRDLELRWALTLEEALAVTKRDRPKLVLAREDMALAYLGARGGDVTPVVVLLEADGWDRREEYSKAGATALVWAGNAERIAEAISELTGTSFRTHPRVSYHDVVDAYRGKEKLFLSTVELSTSGVVVESFPGARIGERMTLDFLMLDPPLSVPALIVRRSPNEDDDVIGMCFESISDADRARLARMIQAEHDKAVPLPEPTGLIPNMSGTYSLDLFVSQGAEDDTAFRVMLRNHTLGSDRRRLPSWLERVGRSLTPVERKALITGGPDYASGAIDVRIGLARSLAESLRPTPNHQEGARSLEYCRVLCDQVQKQGEAARADATQIRASLLRSVYGTVLGVRQATLDLDMNVDPLAAVQVA